MPASPLTLLSFLGSCCLVTTNLHQQSPASDRTFSLKNSTPHIWTQTTVWMEAKTNAVWEATGEVTKFVLLISEDSSHLGFSGLSSDFTRNLSLISYQVSRHHVLKQCITNASQTFNIYFTTFNCFSFNFLLFLFLFSDYK